MQGKQGDDVFITTGNHVRRGKIVEVVPPWTIPKLYANQTVSTSRRGVSYLVEVNGKILWPRIETLSLCNQTKEQQADFFMEAS
jgi:hypothetical protein